jgi:hypothetical protein
MSRSYGDLVFTSAVKAAQQAAGSRRFGRRSDAPLTVPRDVPAAPLTDDERIYLEAGRLLPRHDQRDRVASRPVPRRTTRLPASPRRPHNRLGRVPRQPAVCQRRNLSGDVRVALIVMDSPNQQRLKIFGRARLADQECDPDLLAAITHLRYNAIVERAVVISVATYDWNCPQHIVPRDTAAEIEPIISPLCDQLDACQAENRRLRGGGQVS